MKRMSEVFELPVRAVDIEWLTMQSSDDTDEAIAHAINHLDALADALASLLKATDGYSAWWYKEHRNATKALAAYRGGK